MALTESSLYTGTVAGASITSSSFTPAANDWIIVSLLGEANGVQPVLTVADSLGQTTFMALAYQTPSSPPNFTFGQVWYGRATSAAARTITVSSNLSLNTMTVAIDKVTGAANAVGATVTVDNSFTASPPTATLSTAPATLSLVHSTVIGQGTTTSSSIPAGYTSLNVLTDGIVTGVLDTAYKNGEVDPTVAWTGASNTYQWEWVVEFPIRPPFSGQHAFPTADVTTAGWVNEDEGSTLYSHVDGDGGEFVTSHRRHLNGPKRILLAITDDGARFPMDHVATITTCPPVPSRVGQRAREQTITRICNLATNFIAMRTDQDPCAPGRVSIACAQRAGEHFLDDVNVSNYFNYIQNGIRDSHWADGQKMFPGPVTTDCALLAVAAFYRDITPTIGSIADWNSGTSYSAGQKVKRICNTWDVLTTYTTGDTVQLQTTGHKYQCVVAASTVGSIPTTATSQWTDIGAGNPRYFIARQNTTAGRPPEIACSDLLPDWRDYGTASGIADMDAQLPVKAHDQPFGDCTSTGRNTYEARGDGAAEVWQSGVTYKLNHWVICGSRMYQSRNNSNLGHQPFPGGTASDFWQDQGVWIDDLQMTGCLTTWLSHTGKAKSYLIEKLQNWQGQVWTGSGNQAPWNSADPTQATADYWLAGTTYASGAKVAYHGYFYTSLQNANTNHQPDTASAWWGSPTPAYNTRRVDAGWRRFTINTGTDVEDHYRSTQIDFDELVGGPNPANSPVGQIGQTSSLQYDWEIDSLTYNAGTNKVTVVTQAALPTSGNAFITPGEVIRASVDRMTGGSGWFLAEGDITVVDNKTFTYTPSFTPTSSGGTRSGNTSSNTQLLISGGSSNDIGCMISGTDLQAGTRITGFNAGTNTYTISKAATGTHTGVTFTIGVNVATAFFYVRKFFEPVYYGAKHIAVLDDVSPYDNVLVQHGFNMPHWSSNPIGGIRSAAETQCERRYENSTYNSVPVTQAWGWNGVLGTPGNPSYGPDVSSAEAADVTNQQIWAARQNMFASFDDQLGEVMDAWDAKFGVGTYYVILVDDNGYQYGGHHVGSGVGNADYDDAWAPVGGKTAIYENSVRVSLFIKGPGFDPGVQSSILVELSDIPMTILRIMADAIPELNNHHAFTKRIGEPIQNKLAGTSTANKHQFCRGKYLQGAGGTGPGGQVKRHPKVIDKDGNTRIQLWNGVIEQGVPAAWVSGHSYVAGDQSIDASNNYTCILATNGTTAPHSDPTHWARQYDQLFLGDGPGSGMPDETEYETIDHKNDNAGTQAIHAGLLSVMRQLMVGRWEPSRNVHTGKL